MAKTRGPSSVKRPSKSEIDSLVHAFGRYSHSQGAPLPTQQRLYTIYRNILSRLQAKYPHVDMESDGFQRSLEAKADAWWDAKAFKGSSVDW